MARTYIYAAITLFGFYAALAGGCTDKKEGAKHTETPTVVQPTISATPGSNSEAQDLPKNAAAKEEVQPEANEPSADTVAEDQSELDCESDEIVCPLFDWMDKNTVPAMENQDLAAIARALHQIEFMAPEPTWNDGDKGWAQIARKGAVEAEAGNFKGVKASCKSCHKAWRDQFRTQYRLNPVPNLPPEANKGLPGLEL